MNREEIIKFFNEKLKENNIKISDEQMNNFILYMDNLIEWNKKINLTAIKEEKDFSKVFLEIRLPNQYQ